MHFTWLDINSSFSHSSLSLAALTAQLDEQLLIEHQWNIIRGSIKSDSSVIVSEIILNDPDVIFATCWLFNIEYILTLLSKYTSLKPNCKVYLGGPEFSGENEPILHRYPFITGVFNGEGEEIFNRFIHSLTREEFYPPIEGFCYNLSANSTDSDGFSCLDGNLSGKSTPSKKVNSFSTLRAPEQSPFFDWNKPFVYLETSRGCFNSCAFCVSGSQERIQYLDPEAIDQRIQFIKSKGIKEIRILDRTFNAESQKAIDMLDVFVKYCGEIRFHVEVHPAFLNNRIRDYLRNAPPDFLHIEAGVQSLHDHVLLASGRKGLSTASMDGILFLQSLNRYDIHLDLIAGLPEYSYQELLTDIDRLISIRPAEIQLELLKLLPGTLLRQKSKEYEIKYSPLPPYEVMETDAVSYNELQKIKTISKLIDYWYNSPVWKEAFITIYDRLTNNEEENPKMKIKEIEKGQKVDMFWEWLLSFVDGEHLLEKLHSLENKGNILYDFTEKYCKEFTSHISAAWVSAGLSLKKPVAANHIKLWHSPDCARITDADKDIAFENPLYIPGDSHISYYYLVHHNSIQWFAFDKRISRNKPFIEKVTID